LGVFLETKKSLVMEEELKDKFAKLVFDFQLTNYRNLGESQTRLSFIDKFWNYLGWDVSNLEQVQVEVTDRKHKRPDYRFIKNKKTAFFVEAKKPAEDLRNPKHIYQTKLYCWNGGVPLAILTDFEEFRPFRALGKPKPEDGNKGLIKQFDITFEAYPDLAYELLNNFGREAVLGGSLDALVKPTKLELRDTVDKNFLITLSQWRIDLATEINKSNNFANEFELSEAVQRILDRLVFLRILQDRDIETLDYIRLISSFKVGDAYREFVKICKQLAPKYNGLIFNSHPLSENLKVESTLFKRIVKELVYEDSPYRFDEMPVEVLGTIYERFLGDEINFNKKGKVVIDAKPEVRKAGGVYYTPQYIVEYIVQNTVGKLLEKCKTPDEVSKLKILDPACGSGSFLLGAFDLLIKWHEDYFSANPGKAVEKSGKQSYLLAYPDSAGQTKLTARMKGKILQNNIYGVDLDKQATEVAQMSLYIKVLEGMANESQMSLGFRDAILPKLDDNIKCGNSLIGTDFIKEDFFGLSEKEKHKINPFDWEENFPFIKETGGFDAVIGNPPYGALFIDYLKPYLKNNYRDSDIELESYLMFIEKSLMLIKDKGLFGYIIPSNLLTNTRFYKIRKRIIDQTRIDKLIDLGSGVFQEASVDTMVLIFQKGFEMKNIFDGYVGNIELMDNIDYKTFSQDEFKKNESFIFNIYASEKDLSIIQKIARKGVPLSDFINFYRGIEFGYKSDYVSNSRVNNNYKPLIAGRCINRYSLVFENQFVNYDENDISNFKERRIYEENKILMRRIGKRIIAIYDDEKYYNVCDVYNLLPKNQINLKFLLGILNSKLISYYLDINFKNAKKLFPKIPIKYLEKLPIAQAKRESEIISLVELMLKLHKDLQTANNFDRKHIENYIKTTDKQIDALVYELYGLTEEEIKIVENG
jgi:type I restriction-modification system DNA methylase subunit